MLVFSAHPNGQSVVSAGEYPGKTLGQLWDEKRELFGEVEGNTFPLLTKILDANNDLSVQVHPNDAYANDHENGELGKTECWYIIDCKEGADMIYGHNAASKEELIQMVNSGEWNSLLRRVKIKPGDFFYVPSGTIHALCVRVHLSLKRSRALIQLIVCMIMTVRMTKGTNVNCIWRKRLM